jgi:hypothetical protein
MVDAVPVVDEEQELGLGALVWWGVNPTFVEGGFEIFGCCPILGLAGGHHSDLGSQTLVMEQISACMGSGLAQ